MKSQLSRFTRCGKCHEANTITKTNHPTRGKERLPPELFTHNPTLAHMKQTKKRSRLARLSALLFRCVFVALMGVIVLITSNTVHAVTFVSNFDQPYTWVHKERRVNDLGLSTEITTNVPYAIWVDGGLAQGFRTGSNESGYNVSSVEIHIGKADRDLMVIPSSVSLWSSSGGAPKSLLYTFTLLPDSFVAGFSLASIKFESNAILESDTSYFIVIKSSEQSRITITSSSAEDAGSLAGWSIRNTLMGKDGDHWRFMHREDVGSVFPEGAGVTPALRIGIQGFLLDSRSIIVSLTQVGEGQFKATRTTSVPFDIVLPITVVNGTIVDGATTVTIPSGSRESDVINVSRIPGTTFPVSVDIGNLPSPPAGYALFKSQSHLPLQVLEGLSGGITPVSERTPQVRDAIVAAVRGVNSANDVTEAHLAAITTLRANHPSGTVLPSRPIEFRIGDFSGLTALTRLELGYYSRGVILPDGIFDDLTSLKELNLYSTGHASIPSTVRSLTSLTSLNLGYNGLTSLPAGVFDNLTQLTSLDLSGNGLASLPDGVFDQLTVLTYLNLEYNDLTSVPDGVFDNLTSLTRLTLSGLELTSLPDGVFDNLTSLTRLTMRDSLISSLSADDFSGLSSLTSLDMSGSRLTSLPVGIFSGLLSLVSLHLGRNSVDPLPLTVSLEKVGEGQFKAVAPTGAPFDIVLPLNVRNGSISGGTNTLTIPKGSVESASLTVTRTPGTTAAVAADIGTLPGLPTDVNQSGYPLHQGYTLVKSNNLPLVAISRLASGITPVSERTPQVREAILGVVQLDYPSVSSYTDITETHLAGITALYLNGRNITALKVGDFDGLTSLEELRLYNNQLTTLPEDIFDGLTALTTLRLYGNQLSALPEDIFDELIALTTLQLGLNQFTTLPGSIFDGLTKLTDLRMIGNQFTTLPEGIFEGLTALTTLYLGDNAVNPLPLTVSLEKVGEDGFKATAPTGASFDIVLPLSVANGTIDNGATTLTIPAGGLESEPLTVLRTSSRVSTVTVNIGTLPGLPANHSGYSLVKSDDLPLTFTNLGPVFTPVSERTPQVRDQITLLVRAKFRDVNSVNDVTPAHLRSITTSLDLRNKSITSLKAGDFSGMSSLEKLILNQNSIVSLPEEVFNGLSALKELWIQANALTSLPAGVFEGLSALERLQLSSNSLTSLPEEVFDGLSNLTTLDLYNNSLSSLPEEVFEGLSSLTLIRLTSNELTSLPEDVFDGLSNLTTLNLHNNSLNSLPEEVFDGLSALTTLNLSSNALTSLPMGVFEGLSNLTSLSMHSNSAFLSLTVSLEKAGEGQFKAVAPTGAPFDIVLPLSITNGSISGGATAITIPVGSVESEILTVTRTPGTSSAVVADIETLPARPSSHDGYSLIKPASLPLVFTELGGAALTPVSERTPQVRDAIVAAVSGINSANDVTVAHLMAITHLNNLKNQSITSLKVGDFDGLTALSNLDLRDNELTTLPAGIFKDLTALTSLGLQDNDLKTLPLGTFDGLTALTFLGLSNNILTTLSAGIFKDLTALKRLWLTDNTLATLPAGIFDGLTALDWLFLHHNALTTLPAGIFDGLTSLTQLDLNDNTLTTLPAGIFDGLTAVTSIDLLHNELISLPDGLFKGLTALKLFRLGSSTVAPLPLSVSLEKIADGQFKAVAPTGAPFELVLPLTVENGTINSGASTITIPQGSIESAPLTVTRTPDPHTAVTANIGTLPGLPSNHYGYILAKSDALPLEVIDVAAVTTPDTGKAETAVNIPDPNLRAKIESALGKTSGATISATEMATLTTFTAQDASITNLTGLETATNLITLKLGNNTISNISALSGLTSLTELQLWDNQITTLSSLAGLTNLIKLYLWGNNISDISHLSGLTSLTQLRIGENSISNISAVSSLRNLTYLSVKENAITDISAVSGLTNLTELVIGNNAITNISAVAKLTNLVWLDARNNSISDISAVANLTNLTSLMLTGNTTSDISTLTGLTKLIELYLGENSVSDLSPLVTNTGLGEDTEIDVRGNPLSYPSIYTHIPTLQTRSVYVDFDNRVATAPLKISGDTQQGTPGAALAQPFVVEVRDGSSVAFAGVPVNFAVTAGGGTLSTTNTTTDVNGRAETTLTLGNTTDTNTVRVSVTGITQTITFTATGTTAPIVSVSPIVNRTPQVRDAIVTALPGINSANDVTEAHLATITHLDLENKNILTLKDGDFDGLSALTELRLQENQLTTLPANIFSGLSSLRTLYLNNNRLSSLPSTVFSGLSSLSNLYMNNNQLTSLPALVFSGLTSLRQINMHTNLLTTLPVNVFSGLSSLNQISINNNRLTSLPENVFSGRIGLIYLYLDGNRLTSLPANLFSGLSALEQLKFNNNQLSSLPAGLFRGLSSLTWLLVQDNTVNPLPFTVSLEKVGTNQFKATAPVGAPFAMTIPITVVNGSISGGATILTIPAGGVESQAHTVIRTPGTTAAVTVDIGTLPGLPAQHQGYELVKSTDLPLTIFSTPSNSAPVFTDGTSTMRTIAENTAAGIHIGTAIAATDTENDTLTYTLSGNPDASSFDIDSSTGQLQTSAVLDYETKSTYTVTITVSDGSLTDTIAVTINVTDINELPTDAGVCKVGDILAPGESCTYPGTDATFSVLDNGQAQWNIPDLPPLLAWINQTSIGGSLSISTTINGETYHFVAEELSSGSWEIKEIGDSSVQQPDPPQQPEETETESVTPTLSVSTASPLTEATLHESVLTFILSGGTYERSSFSIRNAITVSGIAGVTVGTFGVDRVSDTEATVELEFNGNINTDSTLTISMGAGAIADYDGTALTAQIPVSANTESVVATTAAPLTEATLDGSVVTLTLSGRTYESSGVRIRNAVAVSGISGVTVGTFDIDRVSDTQVTVELTFNGNINTDSTLTFTVGADALAGYDGAALTVQVSVSATTEAPEDTGGQTPQQPGDVGGTPTLTTSTTAPLTETTLDESVVTLTLSGGTYHTNWGVLSQRVTVSGIDGVIVQVFNIERVSDTEVTVELTFDDTDFDTNSTITFTVGAGAIADYDGTALTAQIPVTASTESVVASTTSPLTEDTLDGSVVTLTLSGRNYESSGVRIRNAVTVSGIDGVTVGTFDIDRVSDTQVTVELTFDGNISTDGTLTFTVGPGAIAGYNGPALTTQVSVTASTETPTPTNTAPTFTAGSTTTRTVAENTVANVNVGSAVAATDANNDTLTYTLGGTDANVFSIESTTGQLKTRAALDYETKRTYTVTITVSDGNGGSDSITVTITVTNVVENRAPVFTDGVSTTRSVTENTAARQNIGRTISATDPNGDTLRYNLSGTEAASFRIDGTTGQLRTWAALDYETKRTYTVTVTVSDGSLTDTITVTINVTDVDDTPTLNVSTAVPLTEATLHGSVVTLTLSKSTYHTNWNFVSQNVEVSGITGVTFRRHNVVRVSDTKVTVELEFNGNISTNSTLTFTVGAGAIANYNGSALTAQLAVTASTETPGGNVGGTPTLSASTTAPLTEVTLDGNVVTLRVTGGIYKDNWNFVNRNVKVSGIAGVTFSPFNLDIESDTEITVELDFDGTDFDANSTLTFTVEPEAMVNYTGPALSAQISVTALTESVVATTAAPLTEATLDGSVVTLTLSGRTYESSIFTIRDAVTVSGITGVTVGTFGVDRVSDTQITVELTFDGNINTDSTLTFTVGADAIVGGYNGSALTAQVSVSAGEAPVEQVPDTPEQPEQPEGVGGTPTLSASTAAPLTEATLDESVVSSRHNCGTVDRGNPG